MIIITSASRGIGKFLFNKFRSEGKEVIGFYNNTVPENLEDYYKIDITNKDEIILFFNKFEKKLNTLILINTAGISYNSFSHKADIEKWRAVLDVNLISLFSMINLSLPIMRENNFGRIINLSSIVAQKGTVGTSAYAASKSALWGLSKSIAVENANKNITINNINLGYFDIGMIEQVPQDHINLLISNIPAKRLGHPEEIYLTVQYILNTEYLNGTSIDLNGGLF